MIEIVITAMLKIFVFISVPVCDDNSHYEHEGTACPNTCSNQNAASNCVLPNVAG